MEEDLIIPHDSTKNCSISLIEDEKEKEKEKVKDFVYKHLKDVTDKSLFNNVEESSVKEHGSSTKKDKQTLNKGHCKNQQGAFFSGKILSYGCLVCKDAQTYSPNDLLKHFQVAHEGTLPTYPCDLCGFVTNEFSFLQRHRIEHRNTLVTCELCNDGVQYSLLLLTRHYTMYHSLNGQFNCDWCDFTTLDAGTFVQHMHHHNEDHWKCSKCTHISLSEEDHQTHMKAHSGTFPFTCQICGYGASRSESLKKHTAAVHKQEAEKINASKPPEDAGTPAAASATLKLLLKKGVGSQEVQRISKLNCLSGSLTNQNGRLSKPDLSSDETQHTTEGTTAKKDNNNGSKTPHSTEVSTSVMLQECDNAAGADAANHTNPNGVTVLRVKNKISLPPNCTTKVMGFKMVDGKKHLVLKVIPAAKQDSPVQNSSSVEDAGIVASKPVVEKSKESLENGDCHDGKDSKSHRFAVSPTNGSCRQMGHDDIMAVKVKTEEEETSICNFDSNLKNQDGGAQTNPLQVKSPEKRTTDNNSVSTSCRSAAADLSASRKSHFNNSSSKVAQELLLSKAASKTTAENCGGANEVLTGAVNDQLLDKHNGDSSSEAMQNDDRLCHSTPEKTNGLAPEIKLELNQQNFENLSPNLKRPPESSPPGPGSYRETVVGSGNCTQSSPNHEVFSFHNYSKETYSASPNTTQSFDSMSEDLDDKEGVSESSQFSLTLDESPELRSGSGNDEATNESNQDDEKKVSDTEIEVDEGISSVDDPNITDENFESVFQDFNIIKIEEDSIPISKNPAETISSSASCGSFVEEHSNAIISQQLSKEKNQSVGSDSLKQTKTTLRILQLPEGNQPVLLRTAENRFAMPVQMKPSPGFKLITSSTNPQINVSYMKPGADIATKQTGVSLTPNSRTGGSTQKTVAAEKGPTLLSAVQPGTTSNHFLINSAGLKGSVLLSNPPQNSPVDKSLKAQPTCYLVQRSVPIVQSPNTPGLKLANAQYPANSRPVLAMPVGSADKASSLQPGRQAFLLRYVSPSKSGLLLNNQDAKAGSQCSQSSESTGNKVIFKIVTPSGSLLTSGAATSSSQPLFLATRPQTQCFLVSPNKTHTNASGGVKQLITIQSHAQNQPFISPAQLNVQVQPCDAEKPVLAPRPIRPPSQRKRRRKTLFDELPTAAHKARRLSSKAASERETLLWKPVAKEVERTLRLAPFSPVQQIKCPRRYQPVVVLNHPDADIPEVANIMKVVNRYKGAVTKVSLSQKTIQALAELDAQEKNCSTKGASSGGDEPRPRQVHSSVRERFLLKLKLKKKSKKKYEVVKSVSGGSPESVVFGCWFCGRLFNSQEDWIGHGQRHLMEATRDWNKLF